MAYVRSNLAVVDKIDADRRSVANLGNLGQVREAESLESVIAENFYAQIFSRFVNRYTKNWNDTAKRYPSGLYTETAEQVTPVNYPVKLSQEQAQMMEDAGGNKLYYMLWNPATQQATTGSGQGLGAYIPEGTKIIVQQSGQGWVKATGVNPDTGGNTTGTFYIPLANTRDTFDIKVVEKAFDDQLKGAVVKVLALPKYVNGYTFADIPTMIDLTLNFLVTAMCQVGELRFYNFSDCDPKTYI